mgnify:FL=1|tara:strand:+ start:16509 stop:16940 length:432 start_codon:yes stop_codon:yes gene_type:complete
MQRGFTTQHTARTDDLQTAVTRFVDRWLVLNKVSFKHRSDMIGIDNRTYNRLRVGDRNLRSAQMVELADGLRVAPYYLAIPGSVGLSDHQMKSAITDAARFQLAIGQMLTLPAEERSILFRQIHTLAEAAAIKQRDKIARGNI